MTAILIKKQQTAEKERIIAEGRGETERDMGMGRRGGLYLGHRGTAFSPTPS